MTSNWVQTGDLISVCYSLMTKFKKNKACCILVDLDIFKSDMSSFINFSCNTVRIHLFQEFFKLMEF